MDERESKQLLQAAVDRRLAAMGKDPWLAQKVLREAGQPAPHTRRKLSVGLITALALMLAAVTAAAAVLLSGKEFIAQFGAPMAQETSGAQWTAEDVEKLLALAEGSGVEITEGIRKAANDPHGIYKEELLRQFMKADYGFSPAAWPLEEQAWYDELCVRCGLQNERTRFLPADGEISEATALAIAAAYVQSRWAADVSSPAQYRRYIQYMADDNGGRRWDIEFESADGSIFVVCIAPDGSVHEDEFMTYFRAAEPPRPTVPAIHGLNELAALIRDDSFYTVENLAAYADAYGDIVRQIGSTRDDELLVMQLLADIPYAMPREGDLSPADAMALSEQLAAENGWTQEQLGQCRRSVSYRQYSGEAPVYRVCFKLKSREPFYRGEMPFGLIIYLNPASGEPIRVTPLTELDDFDRYCEFPDPHDGFRRPGVG